MKNNGKVRDVRSLAYKIKVLNGRVPGTWKWTIRNRCEKPFDEIFKWILCQRIHFKISSNGDCKSNSWKHRLILLYERTKELP